MAATAATTATAPAAMGAREPAPLFLAVVLAAAAADVPLAGDEAEPEPAPMAEVETPAEEATTGAADEPLAAPALADDAAEAPAVVDLDLWLLVVDELPAAAPEAVPVAISVWKRSVVCGKRTGWATVALWPKHGTHGSSAVSGGALGEDRGGEKSGEGELELHGYRYGAGFLRLRGRVGAGIKTRSVGEDMV